MKVIGKPISRWQIDMLVMESMKKQSLYSKKSFAVQPVPRYIDQLESIAQLYLRMHKKSAAKQSYKRELQLLKEEWAQEDSADVQRVKALIKKV